MDRERERLTTDPVDRDRDRDRTFETSQSESVKRSEAKLESEHERDLDGSSRDSSTMDKERMDRDLGSVQGFEDLSKAERTESLEGESTALLSCIAPFLFQFFAGPRFQQMNGLHSTAVEVDGEGQPVRVKV